MPLFHECSDTLPEILAAHQRKYLQIDTLNMLDKALAIDAYASALRAREGTRLAAAQTLIAAALKVGPDPDLSEMKELVARHPLLNP